MIATVVALWLAQAVTASPSPQPAHDATHPIVMQQAAGEVANAKVVVPTSTTPVGRGAAPAVTQTPNTLNREVFGFALASSLNDPTFGDPTWDFSLLGTVAFFGLHINDDGTIASDSGLTVWNSSELTDLLTMAHAHGTKVVVTIIEQDFGSGTPHMCAALTNRATAVSQTVAQVTAKGVDGVNIDFEGLNGNCPNGQTARSMMTDLAHQLRAALPASSYLSVDTYASAAADSLGFFDVPGLNAYVDSFFVMAYDLEYSNYSRPPTSCVSFCLGPTAPLTSYYYNDTTTASQYVGVVTASKVILGVPYYGRKACVPGTGPNQYPSDTPVADTYLDAIGESSSPQVRAGSYVTHRDANDPSGMERWDTWFNTTLSCNRELYWDDTVSLGAKYDLVNADGLRGVGIWNLNYGGGATELWNALHSHFVGCTSANLSANPASPLAARATVQLTASTTTCANAEYRFFVQPPGGSWTAQTAYGGPTWAWNTSGLAAGVYGIGVWVRGQGSPEPYQAYYLGTYILEPLNCMAAGLSAGTPAPQPPGTNISFTASAAGCPNPQYRFWVKAPGGAWTMLRDWGAATWTWDTTGFGGGTYQIGVWARDSSSTASYDTYYIGTYQLVSTCTSAAISTAATSPKPAGTQVTFTGTSTNCTAPRYEFWGRAPGGTWRLIQPYGTANTFTWNSAGAAPGGYQVGVWAQQAGAAGAYDAYAITTFWISP